MAHSLFPRVQNGEIHESGLGQGNRRIGNEKKSKDASVFVLS